MVIEVGYSNAALTDLKTIFDWVADVAGVEVAATYVKRIEARCGSLADFPSRGTPRGPDGMRSIPFERRATIVYRVEPTFIVVLGIFHAGREIDLG